MLLPFVQVAQAMAQKYHVTVTNPTTYMNPSNGGEESYLIMQKTITLTVKVTCLFSLNVLTLFLVSNGFQAMITQHAWMFLSSFRKAAL